MYAQRKYQCEDCEKIHDDEDDAQKCCAPEVVDVYVCGKCGEGFAYMTKREQETAKQEAEQCCTDEEGNEIITLADLEEVGQLRLPV